MRIAVLSGLALLFLGFVALGTWQVERRAWKLDLIDRVERRIHAAPTPAPGPAQWPLLTKAADEYRHVTATGRFIAGAETRVQAVTELGAGHWLMTPLLTADGSSILVNRGFVATAPSTPAALTAGASSSTGPLVTVDGLLRLSEPGGGFLRRNDAAADRWYSRDVAAIAAARGLTGAVAPYFIDAGATPGSTSTSVSTSTPTSASAAASASAAPLASTEPIGGLTVVAFSNNHLVYAITWYALALLVLVAARHVGVDSRRRPRPPPGRGAAST